jgi:hypothetical protein
MERLEDQFLKESRTYSPLNLTVDHTKRFGPHDARPHETKLIEGQITRQSACHASLCYTFLLTKINAETDCNCRDLMYLDQHDDSCVRCHFHLTWIGGDISSPPSRGTRKSSATACEYVNHKQKLARYRIPANHLQGKFMPRH